MIYKEIASSLSMRLAIFFVLMLPREIQHKLNQTDQHPHRVHDKSHDCYRNHNRSMFQMEFYSIFILGWVLSASLLVKIVWDLKKKTGEA